MANSREFEPKNIRSTDDLVNRARVGSVSFSPGDELEHKPGSYQQVFAKDFQRPREFTKDRDWNEMKRLMTGKPREDKGRVE